MKILIDNGHGKNTPGKRSPDSKFREYSYAREIAKSIEGELKFLGIDAERIVTESEDSAAITNYENICTRSTINLILRATVIMRLLVYA